MFIDELTCKDMAESELFAKKLKTTQGTSFMVS